MARTAPPGFSSNYDALLAVFRFGPVIWGCADLRALEFHAERSVAYGKVSDRHTETQALKGVYSTHQLDWVRGPAGLSRRAWYKANANLASEGILRKAKGDGRYGAVEYEIDWVAFKSRITQWKARQSALSDSEGCTTCTPQQASRGAQFAPEGCTVCTPDKAEPHGKHVATAYGDASEGCTTCTRQSDFDTTDSDSRSDGHLHLARISLELEIACNERPRTDGPAKTIRQVLRTLESKGHPIPVPVFVRFLSDKANDFRARRYPFNAGLLAKAFREEIFKWLNDPGNRNFIVEQHREAERARQRAAEVKPMPAKEPNEGDEDPFNREMAQQIQKRVGKLR